MRSRIAAAAVTAVLALSACGGGPPEASEGETIEVDGLEMELVELSWGLVEWELTGTEAGAECPQAGETFAEIGEGRRVSYSRTTAWSCVSLREGETGRSRALADEQLLEPETVTVVWERGGVELARWTKD